MLKSSEIARKYVIILLLKGRVNMANTKKKSTNASSNTASKKNNTPKKGTNMNNISIKGVCECADLDRRIKLNTCSIVVQKENDKISNVYYSVSG